ncbi:MAG: hypothetical protein ACK5NG_06975 [Chthoniobacterales bacterium]
MAVSSNRDLEWSVFRSLSEDSSGSFMGSCQAPAYDEKLFFGSLGFQFFLDVLDQAFALDVDFVLGVEEGAAAFLAVGFEGLDLFLTGEIFLQRESGRGGAFAGGFPDGPG